MIIHRNSGATLQQVMYKTAPNAVAQACKMRCHPNVFAPVLAIGDDGYAMPLLHPRTTVRQLNTALGLLSCLWEDNTVPSQLICNRYSHHVMFVESICPDVLSSMLRDLWVKAADKPGQAVLHVHGDPTTENIMVDDKEHVVWTDPSVRGMPREKEFDLGKLLQSYYGYNELTTDESNSVWRFVEAQNCYPDLLAYYTMTHLVRLYNVQKHKQQWAVSVAQKLVKEGLNL